MPSIEGNVASQVGDNVYRPTAQRVEQQREQDLAARIREAEAAEPKPQVQVDDLESAIEEMRQVMEVASTRQLSFQIYEKDEKQTFVEISERDSGDVIKQIPSEEVLALRKSIKDLVGLFLDERA